MKRYFVNAGSGQLIMLDVDQAATVKELSETLKMPLREISKAEYDKTLKAASPRSEHLLHKEAVYALLEKGEY